MDWLGIRTLPFLTRSNFYREFCQLVPWSVLAGLVEGQFASVVVAKTFDGSAAQIAAAAATPVAALTFSLIWGMLCVGRRKIPLALMFASGTVICAAGVALIPRGPAGANWFIAQMFVAQILLAGVVTVRSAFWRTNYPLAHRGQITARLQRVRFIISVLSVQVAAWLCDGNPASYRYIFAVAAMFGVAGVWMLTRLRIRGEQRELRPSLHTDDDVYRPIPQAAPLGVGTLLSPSRVFDEVYQIFRDDRPFRRYCTAQFMGGVANLMTIAVVVAVITGELLQDATASFWISTTLVIALPRLMMLGSITRWGRYLDHHGVLRLRTINAGCWTVSLLFGLLATVATVEKITLGPAFFPLAVSLFAMRGLIQGLGFGGGALAWNLGHLHFAPPEKAEVYMGIHVSLTGVRGVFAPLAGMWLWGLIGWPVWLIAVGFSLVSHALFWRMARAEQREAADSDRLPAP